MDNKKKLAIIYKVPERDNYLKVVDETSIDSCGGIESWMINMAKQFSRWYEVTVYCFCNFSHIASYHNPYSPVQYTNWVEFVNDVSYKHKKFDYIILNREIPDLITEIRKSECCDKIICQAHDVYMKSFGTSYIWDYECSPLKNSLIKKFVANSEWHKEFMSRNQGIPAEKIEVLPEGLNPEDFKGISCDHEIDHSVLWDSAFNRCPEMLIDDVAPLVRKKIPDFKVEICSYLGLSDKFKNDPNVEVLDSLKHPELVSKLRKHAVWYQTGCFPETFCISVLEAAMAGDDIVMDLKNFGPSCILKPFKDRITLKRTMNTNKMTMYSVTNGTFALESAERIVDSIMNYHKPERVKLREEIKEYVLKNYTWEIAAEKYKEMLDKL